MMTRTLLCSSFIFLATACANKDEPATTAPDSAPPAVAAPTDGVHRYGAPIIASTSVPLTKVLGEPEAWATKTVLVDGAVRKACTKKGCWMELSTSADATAPGCRVTFKDYGFFVPTDSAGSTARVEGVVGVRTVPKDQVDHLEAEGAHFATKLDDGSAREVQIVANGVELRRGARVN